MQLQYTLRLRIFKLALIRRPHMKRSAFRSARWEVQRLLPDKLRPKGKAKSVPPFDKKRRPKYVRLNL